MCVLFIVAIGGETNISTTFNRL